jgi:hypothetical protein
MIGLFRKIFLKILNTSNASKSNLLHDFFW